MELELNTEENKCSPTMESPAYIFFVQFVVRCERLRRECRSETNWTGKWNHKLRGKTRRSFETSYADVRTHKV